MLQLWEYKVVTRTRSVGVMKVGAWDMDVEEMLPRLGEKGWELVAVSTASSFNGANAAGVTSEEKWVFKRPAG